MQHIFFYI